MIPNEVHFVYGLLEQKDEFIFPYYLAIYSCYLINKPDSITFHYQYEPHGEWWDKVKQIPCIKFEEVVAPTHIGSKKIKKFAHAADKLRMDILYTRGGIYMDIDTICVRPYHHLLKNSVVLGQQQPYRICNAIMMTEKKSEFFRIWLDEYEKHFNPDGWEESSIILPDTLAKQHPDLLSLQSKKVFFYPGWTSTYDIFVREYDIPDEMIALHLWESHSIKYMKRIENWNWIYFNSHTLYGKIMLNLLVQIEL